ncbi:hypothetical protein GCM10009850_086530 [Nonomuraea monospora]|uniref:Transposase n=1 Tax=Nonomuraea monospora TaxID=568818 RepID=A0ABN3CUS0_9ACTN
MVRRGHGPALHDPIPCGPAGRGGVRASDRHGELDAIARPLQTTATDASDEARNIVIHAYKADKRRVCRKGNMKPQRVYDVGK